MNPGTDRTRTAFQSGPSLWAAACGAVLALAACEERMAGTSVGTGNPTEIEVAFKDDSGEPVPVTGSLQVYASTQIPVPGFRPQPLVSIEVSGATTASLKAEDLAGLPDSVWPENSKEEDIRKFNFLVSDAGKGRIFEGFKYSRSLGAFIARTQDDHAGVKVILEESLVPLDTLSGSIDTTGFNTKWDYHLFIYGTGFSSKIENGRFGLLGLPQGRYTGNIVLVPSKHSSSSPPDSLSIFDLVGVLDSTGLGHSLGSLRDIVPTPATFSR